MKRLNSIHDAAQPFVQRAKRRASWRGGVEGALAGAVMLAGTLLIGRHGGFTAELIGLALFLVSVAVGVFARLRMVPAVAALLIQIDGDLDLKDRTRTAWELERGGDASLFAAAQITDALNRLSTVTPSEWLPRLTPTFAWIVPVAFALAWTPALLPSRADAPDAMTAPERVAVEAAARVFNEDDTVRRALNDAETVEQALTALAEAERRVERKSEPVRALATARETLQSTAPRDGQRLSDALDAVGSEPPPELVEELRALREKLSGGSLVEALSDIERGRVSAEKMKQIVAALRDLEAQANDKALATLERIREQKRKIAAVALEGKRGDTARVDQVAGTESDDGEVQGAEFGSSPINRTSESTVLTLETLETESNRLESVYTKNREDETNATPELLPFKRVALRASEEAALAINSGALPVAYRDRIGRYFEAIAASAREDQ